MMLLQNTEKDKKTEGIGQDLSREQIGSRTILL